MVNYFQSLKEKPQLKVLFVCLGNICRSPAAEAVMKMIVDEEGNAQRWVIDSAGTGNYHIGSLPDERMRKAAARRGIPMTHHCRQVSVDDFYDFDLIIGMDDNNMRNLHRISPTPETDAKLFPMAAFFPGGDPSVRPALKGLYDGLDYVPDPYYEGPEGFELVLDMLAVACRNLANGVNVC